jgi:hypothetical protein
MPATYHINPDEGLITVQIDGNVDLVDVFETARDLHDDPAYDPELPLLTDLRGMRITLHEAALKPFNRFIISHFGRPRSASIAVVVDQEMDKEQCAAVYWLNCAVSASEMFEDYDLALKWLIRKEFAAAER